MGKKKTKLTLEKKYNLTGWAFLLPAAILIFVFCFYPMAQAIILSFKKTGGAFTGLSNYTRVFQDKTFQQCLFNTFFYFLIQVPIMLVLALILAQLLNSPKIRGKGIFRTLIFLPCATSLVSYSMIFKSLFAPDGVVNRVLTGIGLSSVDWFQSTWPARWVIVIALIWRWTGYNMVFYLSGLQNIEYSVYEAAKIDGASPMQTFFKITLPMLSPMLKIILMLAITGAFKDYESIMVLTNGGPNNRTQVMFLYIYQLIFGKDVGTNPQIGYATVLSLVAALIIGIVTAVYMYFARKLDEVV